MTSLRWVFALALSAAGLPVMADEAPQPTIAIIIDDLGLHETPANALINMEAPLTLAFLPGLRHTDKLARAAHQRGKEVMLHAPMANTRGMTLGPGAMYPSMSREQLVSTLRASLQSVPHVQGINNHMGSLLTQNTTSMGWLMQELQQHPLYFIDSRTIATTVAGPTAARHGIPTADRDVFLDNNPDERAITVAFERLVLRARERGSAVGIGHPYPGTIAVLNRLLPEMDVRGIAIATVSGLLTYRQTIPAANAAILAHRQANSDQQFYTP